MNFDSEFWILLIVLGFAALTVVIVYLTIVTRRQAWSQLAERANLQFNRGNFVSHGLSVSGVYQGHNLTLDTFSRSAGRSSATYTRIVLNLNQPANLDLTLSTEGLFSKVGKLLGMQDIQAGDEALDQRYMIKGQPENLVLSVLQSYDLRQRLLEAPSLYLHVHGQQVYYEKRGFERNENNLIALFDLMNSLAAAVERLQR